MSQNKSKDELFDLWLSKNLKAASGVNPAFAQKVVHGMKYLAAQKMRCKVLLQKRIAGGLIVLWVALIIGLFCCPPVLRHIYVIVGIGVHRTHRRPHPLSTHSLSDFGGSPVCPLYAVGMAAEKFGRQLLIFLRPVEKLNLHRSRHLKIGHSFLLFLFGFCLGFRSLFADINFRSQTAEYQCCLKIAIAARRSR